MLSLLSLVSSTLLCELCTPHLCSLRAEDEYPAEMFDNPLYGSMGKAGTRSKDPEPQRKDQLVPPDAVFPFPKPPDSVEPDRPPVPTPRNRSYTCSETKPSATAPGASQLHLTKKPVMPSRSDGGMAASRPPLPLKSRAGPVPELQPSRPRDYRETSEIHTRQRHSPRSGQPLPKDGRTKLSLLHFLCFINFATFPPPASS